MRAHLQENLHLYGGQTLVNLVNHKGHEKPVKEAFEKYIAQVCTVMQPIVDGSVHHLPQVKLPRTRYEYFDFHSECSKMRWHRISVLIEKLEEELLQNG